MAYNRLCSFVVRHEYGRTRLTGDPVNLGNRDTFYPTLRERAGYAIRSSTIAWEHGGDFRLNLSSTGTQRMSDARMPHQYASDRTQELAHAETLEMHESNVCELVRYSVLQQFPNRRRERVAQDEPLDDG